MAENPTPEKRSIGQRRLAAIMFTDVVGFSARAKANEALTIRLVKRDFEAMTRYSTNNGGQVLKTTGDGLLLSFPTASAAVACAQQVQTMLAHNKKKLAPEQVLEHRIGIHLGDVFVDDMDVMGNDVNIAARVLSEAGGGEICVSQTVYDVVKHRLTIKGIFLGARELKNVGEVSIYRLPLSEEEAKASTPPLTIPAPSPRSKLPLIAVVAGIAIIAIGGAIAWRMQSSESSQTTGPEPTSPTSASSAPTDGAAPTAQFVSTLDRGGNWKGRFGSIAALVFGDVPEKLPAFPMKIALESGAGELEASFAGGTIMVLPMNREPGRGIQRVNSSERISSAFIGQDELKIGLRFPDNKPRRVTLYCAHAGQKEAKRAEMIGIFDPSTGSRLASHLIKDFSDGVYVSFDVSGIVELRIGAAGQNRAVVSALFVDAVASK